MSGVTENGVRSVPIDQEDTTSLLSVKSVQPSPDTMTKLVKRLRALTLTLLPVEADAESLNSPTSRIITPQVIAAYIMAGGDFVEALPYCLLRAQAEFMWDANHNAADYGENYGRAVACEVLARRIVHRAAPDRLYSIMSTRYCHRQVDGDESGMSSALELAIDSQCFIFLSSSEAQDVVISLWRGDWVQRENGHHDIDYVPYQDAGDGRFWSHLDPARLSVPRYQNMFRICVWISFLVVYSQAVREPLERLGNTHQGLDEWEVVLYIMALAFSIEDALKFFKLLRFANWRAFTYWNAVSFLTDSLLLASFILRIVSLGSKDDEYTKQMMIKSFQVLSFVSPLIWTSKFLDSTKIITVFDGYKYIGTMQICVARMLRESGIFFALLSVLGIGFAQGLYALDAADGAIEDPSAVARMLIQALLQQVSPDYDRFTGSPAGLILYYLWNVATAVILLNVLISLFSSAYSDVVEDAEAQYLAFFASKTIGMIRAPDSFVYPAPFNLIEVFFVAPFEILPKFRLGREAYATLNRVVMSTIFIIPLTCIALYESTRDSNKGHWVDNWFRGDNEGSQDSPSNRDPTVNDDNGLQISKVPFTELIKVFPVVTQSSESAVVGQIQEVKQQLAALMAKLDQIQASAS
ncbi:hypothetical protein PLEOSDRAFT_1103521 [Pleurotus ostreatus PC15]|uniref:Ion transport domain-containing protein n=1 Tax=Pleurotus ostreatus (strain PC15) TaxID=1137138 RepID=A0A067NN47_PLEO1|nr:hypothetical protein PLEOSDRAFT_1103521 [Pleurotus ostreatus PC15]